MINFKFFYLIFLLNSSINIFCQVDLKSTFEIKNHKYGKFYKKNKIIKVEKIEFLNKKSYYEILTIKMNNNDIKEIWFSSKGIKFFEKNIKTLNNKKWFVDLDGDNISELILASGDDEGLQFCVNKIFTIKNNIKNLFYFTPLLKVKDSFFWGNVNTIKLFKIYKYDKILVSYVDNFRDDEFSIENTQSVLPCLIFDGSMESIIKIDANIAKNSLNEIVNKVVLKNEINQVSKIQNQWQFKCTSPFTILDINKNLEGIMTLYSDNAIYINVSIFKNDVNENEYYVKFKNTDSQENYYEEKKHTIDEEISKTENIAKLTLKGDKLIMDWYGLYNTKTQTRDFVKECIFVRENGGVNPIVLNKCE